LSVGIIILKDLGFMVAGFLLGSIPFCYLLGKYVGKKNLRQIGDKNPGGWNLVFNVSKFWGFIGIMLDMGKGYLTYFLVYRLAYESGIAVMGTNHNQLIAVLAGCAAVAGHNYSPFLRGNGGKGLAAWGGFYTAANFLALPLGGISMLIGLLVARNMIWSVIFGVLFSGIFLWLYTGAGIFLVSILILFVIMLPKQVNRSLTLGKNFQFRKESSLEDLFKHKIR